VADLTITAADVVAGTNAQTGFGTAGATIAPGDLIYRHATNKTLLLADANSSATTATVEGMALNAATSGQPVKWVSDGEVTVGAVLTVAQSYIASTNAGKVAPISDLASGSWLAYAGYAKTTSILVIKRINSGVQKA
jgi:hypothetical protein